MSELAGPVCWEFGDGPLGLRRVTIEQESGRMLGFYLLTTLVDQRMVSLQEGMEGQTCVTIWDHRSSTRESISVLAHAYRYPARKKLSLTSLWSHLQRRALEAVQNNVTHTNS